MVKELLPIKLTPEQEDVVAWYTRKNGMFRAQCRRNKDEEVGRKEIVGHAEPNNRGRMMPLRRMPER